MLSDEVIDKVIERLISRIENTNEYVISTIARNIKKIGSVSPSDRNKLFQTLKYGGDFDKIVKKIAKLTEMNVYDIYEIFDEVAKSDYKFAKKYYEYRKINYIPYKENKVLQDQVRRLASITAGEYLNFADTRSLGFGFIRPDGSIEFKGLKKTYYDIIDEAFLSVAQGKETFDSAMHRQLKNVAQSGLKVVYPSTYIDKNGVERHYTKRLDSALRQNMHEALTNLHNEMQKEIAEKIDADGWEISVHYFPAEDHAPVQGKQFSKEEYERLQTTGEATTYDKKYIDMHRGAHFRPIGELNCQHWPFATVLGVDRPQYTDEQLQKIIDENDKGFEYEDKHYTMYEGTQLQRRLELEIRKQKDLQIAGVESGNKELIEESQSKITILNRKYKELNNVSGLKPKAYRMKVDGYKRINVSNIK